MLWPLGPRAEVSIGRRDGAEEMSRRWPGRVGAEGMPLRLGQGAQSGNKRVGRTRAQRCHSCYLPLSGDACRHPTHPLAAGSGAAWGGQACLRLPASLGMAQGLCWPLFHKTGPR